jgi:hypothetical protein
LPFWFWCLRGRHLLRLTIGGNFSTSALMPCYRCILHLNRVAGCGFLAHLYLLQSTSYNYDTTRVPSLPDPDNVRVQERVNSHAQVDWNITKSQRFTAVLAADPQ